MTYVQTEEEFLNMLIHNFLIHSFLYYELNTSIIDDHRYDGICIDLVRRKHTDAFKNHKYYNYIKKIDSSHSGFNIQVYPKPIITTAFRCLYHNSNTTESFGAFVVRYGYTLQSHI